MADPRRIWVRPQNSQKRVPNNLRIVEIPIFLEFKNFSMKKMIYKFYVRVGFLIIYKFSAPEFYEIY